MYTALDTRIFLKINGLAGENRWLDLFGLFCAKYLEYILIAILLGVIIFAWNKKNILMATSALVSVIISRLVVTEIIRFFYHHPRPFLVLNEAKQLIFGINSYSFPSGHAISYFSVAIAVFLFNKKLGALSLVLATLISLGRIYVGVHWPSDIIGGVVLAIPAAMGTTVLIKKRFR